MCQPACKSCELSQTAFDIILFLANHPKFYAARNICRIRGIKANAVSFHVERLVQEGYLKREAIAMDRRQVKLLCTEKMEEVIKQGRRIQKQYYEVLTAGISQEQKESFHQCVELIQKI